jgi:hypothetical protein
VKRKGAQRDLFRRTYDQWISAGARPDFANACVAVPGLGAVFIGRNGDFSDDEAALLRRIAAGEASHPLVTSDRARRMLENL